MMADYDNDPYNAEEYDSWWSPLEKAAWRSRMFDVERWSDHEILKPPYNQQDFIDAEEAQQRERDEYRTRMNEIAIMHKMATVLCPRCSEAFLKLPSRRWQRQVMRNDRGTDTISTIASLFILFGAFGLFTNIWAGLGLIGFGIAYFIADKWYEIVAETNKAMEE
jgi:hypothetical protein